MSVVVYRPLGWFRLLLALLVLVSHSRDLLPSFVGSLSLGNVGVLLFFTVSGFVIAEALDTFYRERPKRFLLNRCLKIFPAYWASLPIAAATLWLTGDDMLFTPTAIAANITLLPQYLPRLGGLSWISITWAVLVEFQFYFIAAAMVAFASRARSMSLVVGIAIAAALLMYALVIGTGAQHRFYGAFQFAPFFVAGIALYLTVSRRGQTNELLLAVSAVLAVHAYLTYVDPGEADLTLSAALFCALGALFLALATLDCPPSAKVIDRWLGDLSYPLYLVHMPLIALLQHWHLGFGPICLASIVLAGTIHLGVERPVRRLRSLVRGRAL